MKRARSGGWCWVGIAAWVAWWDLNKKNQTASRFFARNPKIMVPLWVYLTAHLLCWLPEDFDPLRREWARRNQ